MDELQDTFENAPCGLITLFPNGRIAQVNKTFASWMGLPVEELTGKRFSEFLNMAGRIYYETHISPLLRMQGYFNAFACDFVSGSGKILHMIGSATESRDEHGKSVSTRFALILADDRREYERQLVDARNSAQTHLAEEVETAELREQFIAVLGHDLRNPLSSIGAGARLLSKGERTERERQILSMVQNSVSRMAGLIDNVLDFARGRLGGGFTLERKSEFLDAYLKQVIDELRVAAPERSIETVFEMNSSVDCDRGRIGQLVSNLVGNALTHGTPREAVEVHATTSDEVFEFSVANSGVPIPASAMEKLFQPFFRNEVRASRQGLGLGLHIASQIAEAHGGKISVSSTPEETRFTFTMPLQRLPASPTSKTNCS